MSSRGWTCRRTQCGHLNEPTHRKCRGCDAPRPKKRVPAHKKALHLSYEDYLELNEVIHGVGEVCAVCGKERAWDRRLDRDHDHTSYLSGNPWSGQPRGLTCVSCNILMPPKLTARKAREIADYLERVEGHYRLEQIKAERKRQRELDQ